jgi:hypothetical protein
MKAAASIFALAALGGLTLAFIRVTQSQNPPTWMVMGHGLVAATALVTLIVVAVRRGLPSLGKAALAVFVLAAAGGAFLNLNYHSANILLPIPMILLHGGLAVTGFGLLLAALRHSKHSSSVEDAQRGVRNRQALAGSESAGREKSRMRHSA